MDAQAAGLGRFDRFDAPAPPVRRATAVNPPPASQAMLRQLGATGEGFAYGSTALAVALREQRHALIVACLSPSPRLSCWSCGHDEHGIDLLPLTLSRTEDGYGAGADLERQIAAGARGDVLVACDPLGEHELLCRALQLAARRGITTVAITADQPNLLAALANHAVRVPTMQHDAVEGALRHFVQTAGSSLVPLSRRVTGPLRAIEFA